MRNERGKPEKAKISHAFMAWLDQLAPDQQVRAIVLLETQGAKTVSKRQTRAERAASIEKVRRQASSAMVEVDDILQRYRGKRLSERPNALGSVAVEGTPSMIFALARAASVRAVPEDQPVSLVE